jgi:hypothetical protein
VAANKHHATDEITARGGPSPSRAALLISTLSFGIIYFLAAAAAIALTGQAGNIAAVWIAGAILLAALIRTLGSSGGFFLLQLRSAMWLRALPQVAV